MSELTRYDIEKQRFELEMRMLMDDYEPGDIYFLTSYEYALTIEGRIDDRDDHIVGFSLFSRPDIVLPRSFSLQIIYIHIEQGISNPSWDLFPVNIAEFDQLKGLEIDVRVPDYPDFDKIGELVPTSLERLSIDIEHGFRLPKSINKLANIRFLTLKTGFDTQGVDNEEIYNYLAFLKNLEELAITLPLDIDNPVFYTLKNLKQVYLRQPLEKFPNFLFHLPKLEKFSLVNTRIKDLPDAINDIPNLNEITIRGNTPAIDELEIKKRFGRRDRHVSFFIYKDKLS